MNLNPFFCPKCAEIRAVEIGTGTLLIKSEDLYFRSFGMCTVCKEYLKTHTEKEIENNRINFLNKLTQQIKQITKKEEEFFMIYYIEKSSIFSVINFINNLISPNKFSNILSNKVFDNIEYNVRKLLTPVNEEDLRYITDLLKKHKIEYRVEKA